MQTEHRVKRCWTSEYCPHTVPILSLCNITSRETAGVWRPVCQCWSHDGSLPGSLGAQYAQCPAHASPAPDITEWWMGASLECSHTVFNNSRQFRHRYKQCCTIFGEERSS